MQKLPLEGMTFSGGEPMQQVQALLELMSGIRAFAPTMSIGMFTGYAEAELDSGEYATRRKTLAVERRDLWYAARRYLDFVIMGRYDHAHPGTAALRTSTNQRLRLFSARYHEEDFAEQFVEVGIDQDGTAVLTGFPILGSPTL
jgi:organic radical activating enzyme